MWTEEVFHERSATFFQRWHLMFHASYSKFLCSERYPSYKSSHLGILQAQTQMDGSESNFKSWSRLVKPSMEVVIALFPNAISLSFNRQDGRYFFLNRSSIEKICLNDEIWIVEVIFSHKCKRWQPASLFPDLCKIINLLHVFFRI